MTMHSKLYHIRAWFDKDIEDKLVELALIYGVPKSRIVCEAIENMHLAEQDRAQRRSIRPCNK